MVPEENIFKELFKKLHVVAMATWVFDEIEFCNQFLKRNIPAMFSENWPSHFGGGDA